MSLQCAHHDCPNENSLDIAKYSLCGKCKSVRYCSRGCQKKDWKSQKLACNIEYVDTDWLPRSDPRCPRKAHPDYDAIASGIFSMKHLSEAFVVGYIGLAYRIRGWPHRPRIPHSCTEAEPPVKLQLGRYLQKIEEKGLMPDWWVKDFRKKFEVWMECERLCTRFDEASDKLDEAYPSGSRLSNKAVADAVDGGAYLGV